MSSRESVAVLSALLLLLIGVGVAEIMHPVAVTFLVSCVVSGILFVATDRRR